MWLEAPIQLACPANLFSSVANLSDFCEKGKISSYCPKDSLAWLKLNSGFSRSTVYSKLWSTIAPPELRFVVGWVGTVETLAVRHWFSSFFIRMFSLPSSTWADFNDFPLVFCSWVFETRSSMDDCDWLREPALILSYESVKIGITSPSRLVCAADVREVFDLRTIRSTAPLWVMYSIDCTECWILVCSVNPLEDFLEGISWNARCLETISFSFWRLRIIDCLKVIESALRFWDYSVGEVWVGILFGTIGSSFGLFDCRIWKKGLGLVFAFFVSTFLKLSPTRFTVSLTSFDLTTSSNLQSIVSAGDELTSRSQGFPYWSTKMSKPRSSKHVFRFGTTEQ